MGACGSQSSPEGFHSLSVSGKENKNKKRKTVREWRREKSCSPQTTSPSSASVLSLVVIVFLLFAIRQRGTGADLPVAIQPLLHHLGDKWVVAAAGAFLKSHQDPALRHTAVQPLSQQLLLLLFITHLKEKQMWPIRRNHITSPISGYRILLLKLCPSHASVDTERRNLLHKYFMPITKNRCI